MSQENETALEPVPQARVEVLPAKPQRSRLWPLVDAGLVWAVCELLPEILAVWQAARNKTAQPLNLVPDAASQPVSANRTAAARLRGRRFRRGRA